MDKDDKLGFEPVTEAVLICKDCAFRGELQGWPVSKCEAYPNVKPIGIIINKSKDCDFYTKETENF